LYARWRNAHAQARRKGAQGGGSGEKPLETLAVGKIVREEGQLGADKPKSRDAELQVALNEALESYPCMRYRRVVCLMTSSHQEQADDGDCR
jgi:hypothetical protein